MPMIRKITYKLGRHNVHKISLTSVCQTLPRDNSFKKYTHLSHLKFMVPQLLSLPFRDLPQPLHTLIPSNPLFLIPLRPRQPNQPILPRTRHMNPPPIPDTALDHAPPTTTSRGPILLHPPLMILQHQLRVADVEDHGVR